MKYLIKISVRVISLLALNSCGSMGAKNTPQAPVAVNKKDSVGAEFIGDVKLNGVIRSKDSFENVSKFLGMPDSVRKADGKTTLFTAPDTSIVYYHFKGVGFVNDHGIITLESVPIANNKGIFLEIDKFKINSSTTIGDFKKFFPVRANDELSGTDMDKNITIVIPEKVTKDLWFFYFDRGTGKIKEVGFMMPD